MKTLIFCLLHSLFLLSAARAVVVVTYRGDAPNAFGYGAAPTDVDFDVNNDGIQDYRFIGGYFVAAMEKLRDRPLHQFRISDHVNGTTTWMRLLTMRLRSGKIAPHRLHHLVSDTPNRSP